MLFATFNSIRYLDLRKHGNTREQAFFSYRFYESFWNLFRGNVPVNFCSWRL